MTLPLLNPRQSRGLTKLLLTKIARLLKGRDKGTVAITFLLSFPILLLVVGILVQYALLANARLTLDHAVAVAARSAMTSLPTDPVVDSMSGPDYVNRAAWLALEPLSPAAPQVTSDASAVAQSLQQLTGTLPSGFAARYSYAQSATNVQIVPIDANGTILNAAAMNYAAAAAPHVRVTITYNFKLTVPAVNLFAGILLGRNATIAGVPGYYLTLSSSQNVQLSDGREVATGMDGAP